MGSVVRLSLEEVKTLKWVLDKVDLSSKNKHGVIVRIEQDSPSGIGFSTVVTDLDKDVSYDITDVSIW